MFAIGSVLAIAWLERDLENRVENELVDAGFTGVTASFSGQDGRLACEEPIGDRADAAAVAAIARNVYGVDNIALHGACIADLDAVPGAASDPVSDSNPGTAVPPSEATAPEPTEPEPTASEPSGTEPSATNPPDTSEQQPETVADLIAQDPQFSQLASLLTQTGLDETLADGGPFTVLAPTDAAFDAAFEALSADGFADLTSDPERLRPVLLHHVTDGAILSEEFVSGPLAMLDGSIVDVDPSTPDGITFTSGEVVAAIVDPTTQLDAETQLDLEASNGIVHAIDQVLLPADFEIEPVGDATTTSVTLENGQLTLIGSVRSEDQRRQLVAAAEAQVDPANVLDQLVIDPAATITDTDLDRLTLLAGSMPQNLVSGTATLTGDELSLVGVHTGDDANARLEALGIDLAADVSVEARQTADAEGAQALQDELNEFVRTNPILFQANSAELTPEAIGIVEQVAARAQRIDGVDITIIGHTDSDGIAENNRTLSQLRAITVLDALVAQGLDAESLTAEGRGDTEPVLDTDGNEDKVASRRVEFVVTAR